LEEDRSRIEEERTTMEIERRDSLRRNMHRNNGNLIKETNSTKNNSDALKEVHEHH